MPGGWLVDAPFLLGKCLWPSLHRLSLPTFSPSTGIVGGGESQSRLLHQCVPQCTVPHMAPSYIHIGVYQTCCLARSWDPVDSVYALWSIFILIITNLSPAVYPVNPSYKPIPVSLGRPWNHFSWLTWSNFCRWWVWKRTPTCRM